MGQLVVALVHIVTRTVSESFGSHVISRTKLQGKRTERPPKTLWKNSSFMMRMSPVAADWEARHILYGCTSSDDTLSVEWEPASGCEAAPAAAQADSPNVATAHH